jgi:sortase A
MKIKSGSILMTIGLLLIVGAATLTFMNIRDEQNAGEESRKVLDALVNVIPENLTQQSELYESSVMQTVVIDGREYIGRLDIPAIEVSLPVLKDLSLADLKIAPCRYEGSFLTDNMIIGAHNFKTHFANLKKLVGNDEVIFTDVNAVKYVYRVVDIELLLYNESPKLESGDWDLTLFTCTPGGRNRVTVRCDLLNILK